MNDLLLEGRAVLSALRPVWLGDVAFHWPAEIVLVGAAVLAMVVWWLLAVDTKRRRERMARFAERALLPRLGAAPLARHAVLRQWPIALAIVLVALAVAQPTAGYRTVVDQQRGLDVVLAIDASASMLAADERPSRLERLKQEVRRFRAAGPGDRVGLIAFAGRSYILTPLTADAGALDLYIDDLSPETVGQGGSAMSGAMRQGVELLDASASGSDRVLVVLSDGELFEPDSDLRAAAVFARERGVAVVTVGFGTTDGATIPTTENGRTVAKRDGEGRTVTTRYTPATLRAIAEASGGAFVDAAETDRAGRARDALRALRAELRAAQQQRDRIARFPWLVVPALLLLWRDALRSGRARRMRRGISTTFGSSASRAVLVLLAVPCTASLLACTRSGDPARTLAAGDTVAALARYRARVAAGDSAPAARYNVGTALLFADSAPAGITLLEEVRRDAEGEVLARAQYNEGTALLRVAGEAPRGSERLLARSRAQLRAYLTTHPDDADAVWNYELTLRRGAMGGGGSGGDAPTQGGPQPLDAAQSDALLRSAARDERDVQARRARTTRPQPPRGGKDW